MVLSHRTSSISHGIHSPSTVDQRFASRPTPIPTDDNQDHTLDFVNNLRLDSQTSPAKHSMCQTELVDSLHVLSDGLSTPTTSAVVITRCMQTASRESATSSLPSSSSSSAAIVCQVYVTAVADIIRSDTRISPATLRSTVTSCSSADLTKTTRRESDIPMAIPVTIDNSLCFATTSIFTAGSDITITMYTAYKPTTTCRPIG